MSGILQHLSDMFLWILLTAPFYLLVRLLVLRFAFPGRKGSLPHEGC